MINEIIAKLSSMSDDERADALSKILDSFCVACGKERDFHTSVCDCHDMIRSWPKEALEHLSASTQQAYEMGVKEGREAAEATITHIVVK